MKANILGYLVLRTPEYNFDELGRGAFLPYPPKIDNLYYGGVDRMQWFDVDESYYNKSLPSELAEIRKNIFDADSSKSDFKICTVLKDAKMLLEYGNKEKKRNELVAIYSENFVGIEQLIEAEVDENIIGCDLYCNGYGSILREGIFTKPDLFKRFIGELNEYGIFTPRNESIDKYIDTYLSNEDTVERVTGSIYKVTLYRV